MIDQKIAAVWGQIAISILAQLIFAGTVVVSFFLNDSNILLLVVGAVIANATTTIQFWVGSSSGSQKKDDAIATQTDTIIRQDRPTGTTIIKP